MGFSSKDIVPLSQARANLSELVDEVRSGKVEKIITKNGESCAALISTEKLERYYRAERNQIHLVLLQDALAGLKDFEAGRHEDAYEALARFKARAQKKPDGDGGASE